MDGVVAYRLLKKMEKKINSKVTFEIYVIAKPFFQTCEWAMAPVSSCDCPHLECVGEVTKEELIQKSHVCTFKKKS